MTSYASEMPGSPGCIDQFDVYKTKRPQNSPYEEQKQKLDSVQQENLRLKAKLTRVQNEYEELRDESNYQRAKVSELQELVSTCNSQPSSFQSQNTCAESDKNSESTVKSSLMKKSFQNAELTLAVDKLKIELRKAQKRLCDLEQEKRINGMLLVEMGDVIRTLNAVNIEYSAFAPNGKKDLSPQQQSIKNIKLKVEAMLKDRDIVFRKCRELNELSLAQEQKIRALEEQFHMVNTINQSQVNLSEIEPDVSLAASTFTEDSKSQHSSAAESMESVSLGKTSRGIATDAAASEIARQSQELAKFKSSQKKQVVTISRLKNENKRLSSDLSNLKESFDSTKELLGDAVSKRDEFRESLVDILAQYKDLQCDHLDTNNKIAHLQTMVTTLSTKVKEQEKTIENQGPTESKEITAEDCKMDDLLVAYANAQKQIQDLRETLAQKELGVGPAQDIMDRFNKMEQERNDFQRKYDKALEETRLAKQELQKEKDESKLVRRQLKALMQNRDDDTASLESCMSRRSTGSSMRSRASTKKALVEKASFKPLTVEELMAKDFD